jgi:hypothetical protein
MIPNWTLLDEKGYCARRDEIDAAIIEACSGDGKTYAELAEILRQMGIGNARYCDPHELSYSMTGAVTRAAVNSLCSRGILYDSWDLGREYPRPFRFYKVAA